MHAADAADKAITGSTKKHIVSRLRRAVQGASHLSNLLQENPKTMVRLEAMAYEAMLRGALHFEAQKWEQSLAVYSEAHVAYRALIKTALAGQDDNSQELITTNIEPSLRYAAYQLRLPRTLSIQRIVLLHARKDSDICREVLELDPTALDAAQPASEQDQSVDPGEIPKTISWRQRIVPLEDASIAQALANATAGEEVVHRALAQSPEDAEAQASTYDAVLNPSQDAVDATTTALGELSAEGVPPGDGRMQALQITLTATNYALVGWRVGRNRILCGRDDGAHLERFEAIRTKPKATAKKPRSFEDASTLHMSAQEREIGKARLLSRLRERIALYDSTLQSLDSVRSLPGVAADSQLLAELNSRRDYFAALRCCNVAHSHALVMSLPQAVALYARALALSEAVVPDTNIASKAPNLEISKQQAISLVSHLQALTHQHRALAQLAENGSNAEGATNSAYPEDAWVEHLHQYPASGKTVDLTRLVDYPARLRPVPVKPIFLDLAWNHIDYPQRNRNIAVPDKVVVREKQSLAAAAASEDKGEERKGWFNSWRR